MDSCTVPIIKNMEAKTNKTYVGMFCKINLNQTGVMETIYEELGMELYVFTMFVMVTGLIQSIIVLSMVIFKSKFTLDKQRKIIISILLADTLLLLHLTIKQSFMFTQRFQVIIIMSYIQLEAVPLAAGLWSQVCYVISMLVVVRFPLRSRWWKQRNLLKVSLIWIISLIFLVVAYILRSFGGPDACNIYFSCLVIINFMAGPVSLTVIVWIQILICKSVFYSKFPNSNRDTPWMQQVIDIKYSLLKAAVMCLVVSLGIPMNLILSILIQYTQYDINIELFETITYLIGLIALLINPWIYALHGRKIWENLKCGKSGKNNPTENTALSDLALSKYKTLD